MSTDPRLVQPHVARACFGQRQPVLRKLETDQSELFAEVVRDYWRIFTPVCRRLRA